MLELMLAGILEALSPFNLLFIFFSVTLGIIIGALPGFGAATGLIMILPLTYSLDPGTAFVALTGVYIGAEYGGSISSILINTPGTGGAVVTCFDGFPMAQKGKASEALIISNISSFSGGLVSAFTMLFFMPILSAFALLFGAGEIFILAVAGLLLVGSVSKGDIFKGILSATLGVFVTCIGADSFMGHVRFDFNSMILYGGVPFIPVMLGVFSLPHLLTLVLIKKEKQKVIAFDKYGIKENFAMFKHYFKYLFSKCLVLLMRSGFIGVIIGMIPGVGGSVATMVAYSSAKKTSKTPEEFGTGCVEGVAAPEASNNGIVGGSLIPVLALGIPGSPAAAIFMSAIFMHGMTPGPNFLLKQADLVYLLIMSVFLCAFAQLFLGMVSIGSLANILKASPIYLFPALLVICSIGAYVVRGLEFDIFLFGLFGVATYLLIPFGFNSPSFILGMILGAITERSLMESLAIAGAKGSVLEYYLGRPLALIMLGLLAAYFIYCIYAYYKEQQRKKSANEAADSTQKVRVVAQDGSRGARIADMVIAILIFALAFTIQTLAANYPAQSALFPTILSYVFIALGCVIGGRALLFASYYDDKRVLIFADTNIISLISLLVICAIYLFVMNIIGFYVSSFVAVFLISSLLSVVEQNELTKKQGLHSLIFAVVFTPAAYLIFTVLFKIQTPTGMFF